jgi:transcriptional regulator with XRE-family HTH domain
MISDLLKSSREANGWTTRELAEKAEITQSMVSRYESGRVIPSKKIISKLSKVLGVDLNAQSTVKKSNSADIPDENQIHKEFDSKVSKARALSGVDKRVIIGVIDSFLKLKEAQKKINDLGKNLLQTDFS